MQRLALFCLSVAVATTAVACGDGASSPVPGGSSAPATDEIPSAGPARPKDPSFLHVYAGRRVTTYRVDAASGRLRMTFDQDLGDIEAMTGEPRGRFLFAAYDGRGHVHGSIVSYRPHPADGSLSRVSEASSGSPNHATVTWLGASARRVHAMWQRLSWGSFHAYDVDVSHEIADDGELGAAYVGNEGPRRFSGPEAALDARAGVLFRRGESGLTSHRVGRDGALEQTGWSNLCGSRVMTAYPTMDGIYARPLLGVRGVLLGVEITTLVGDKEPLCSWQGPRLVAREELGFRADAMAAYDPIEEAWPAQVAVAVTIPAKSGRRESYELRLYRLTGGAKLELQDVAPTVDVVRQAVFHPAGRYLFVAAGLALQTFSFGPEGDLELVETVSGAGGSLAVTSPQGVVSVGP